MTIMPDESRLSFLRQKLRLLLMLGVPLLAVAAIGGFYLSGGRYVSTDDAFVQAGRVDVSADVAGRVTEVDVGENQFVHQGQTMFKLDDRPFVIALREAQARLEAVRLNVAAMKTSYRGKLDELKAAQDTLGYRRSEFDRQKRLLASGIASQAQYDQAVNALVVAEQQSATLQQQAAGILVNLDNDADVDVDSHPSVQQARAALDQAVLNLSYTDVKASQNGVVTKVDQLQVGDYVTTAKPVFSLMAEGKLWIEANFKETDLTYMRPGQTAEIEIDTYPDHAFAARVVSLSPGTGSSFSLLPPENASGNWVKVVQRLPVRLELDRPADAGGLHVGMSATVEVDTGHHRSLLGSPAAAAIPSGGPEPRQP
jgi:membrane fusion protein (multidrug efflux system)